MAQLLYIFQKESLKRFRLAYSGFNPEKVASITAMIYNVFILASLSNENADIPDVKTGNGKRWLFA